jgi:tRNA dimethylallyltransferase
MARIPVIILFGPTASGKTAVLLNLFSASLSGTAELISADSMQVYRGMDIGTAKPSAEERARLPHHLIDIRDPGEQFNAGDFVRMADEACRDISGRGRIPVISGGTGFYIKNFITGLPEAPPSDPEIRAQLRAELAERGAQSLMDELASVDPAGARRIHINDTYRLLRALEVPRLCGRPLSSFPASGGTPLEAAGNRQSFRFLITALSRPRDELYRRINTRCDSMFDRGLPAEVRRLFDAGYSPKDPGLRAIGYREFFVEEPDDEGGGLKYRLSRDIDGVKALVAQNSRRYAKRQLTFFAGIPNVKWIEAGGGEAAAARLLRREMDGFLAAAPRS